MSIVDRIRQNLHCPFTASTHPSNAGSSSCRGARAARGVITGSGAATAVAMHIASMIVDLIIDITGCCDRRVKYER